MVTWKVLSIIAACVACICVTLGLYVLLTVSLTPLGLFTTTEQPISENLETLLGIVLFCASYAIGFFAAIRTLRRLLKKSP